MLRKKTQTKPKSKKDTRKSPNQPSKVSPKHTTKIKEKPPKPIKSALFRKKQQIDPDSEPITANTEILSNKKLEPILKPSYTVGLVHNSIRNATPLPCTRNEEIVLFSAILEHCIRDEFLVGDIQILPQLITRKGIRLI